MATNPYKVLAGEDLDLQLSKIYFGKSASVTMGAFSTEVKWANILKAKMESVFRTHVLIGRTMANPPGYFARLETGPSTSTEVIAATYPLAIARLGMVLSNRLD